MDIIHQNLEPGNLYHVFNRGINGCETFSERDNYLYFLKRTRNFLSPYFEIYAYCLMNNHFHFLIEPKENVEIKSNSLKGLHSSQGFYSKQIGRLINSYTQSYNRKYSRHGALFESPFKRIPVKSEEQLRRLVVYIHNNPKEIGVHPKDYEFCSYPEIISPKTRIVNKESIEWFDDLENFIFCHR